MARPPEKAARAALRLALGLSAVLVLLRLHLARRVGFGDAEALYACYALHPEPAYLDHPGLIGVIARAVGNGGAPTPEAAHRFTALVASLVPGVGYAAARGAGATSRGALRTFLALALWPELSLGLFALTPDLPLAVLWLGVLGLAALALRSAPGSVLALVSFVFAGLGSGLAVNAKASGALLLLSVAVAFGSRSGRAHLRTPAPWCGLGVAAVLILPLALWEHRAGFPLLHHRLVATQARAGPSFRNLGALAGGQLLYVTPPFLVGAYRVLRALARRTDTPVDRLLFLATVVPGVPLVALCLWSRVAEPHWLAPAYLALSIGAALHPPGSPRLERTALGVGLAAILAGFLAVTTALVPKLSGARYVPRYDLVNDLYAWQAGVPLVREELAAASEQSRDAVVVGPHWTVCAQLHAALGARVPVGCLTKIGDDFSRWLPEKEWARSPTVLFVTDDRFDLVPAKALPDRDVVSVRTVLVYRGGRVVRAIHVARLDRRAITRRPSPTVP